MLPINSALDTMLFPNHDTIALYFVFEADDEEFHLLPAWCDRVDVRWDGD